MQAPGAEPDAAASAPAQRPKRGRFLWLIVLVAALLGLMAASVAVGSRSVGLGDIVAAFSGSTEGFGAAAVAQRIPRTLLAVLVGGALGIAGAVMQGVTRNPLADPGILGVNTGAALAVVSGIAFFGLTTATSYVWAAIAGAGVTAVFVYLVGTLGPRGSTPLNLALAGAATSAALACLVGAVVLVRADITDSARSWQIGGVGGGTFAMISEVLPFLAVGFAVCLLSARGLNLLALGDELAAGLGQRVALARATAALGAVVLCGGATAATGPIAFVGLVVPHVCRLLGGPDHRWLLPFSALGGAALLTAADIAGRVVARPGEIDVGILTAVLGAPFFIAIVRRQKVRAL